MKSHREYADEVMGVKDNPKHWKIFAVFQGILFGIIMMVTASVGFSISLIVSFILISISPLYLRVFLSSFVQYTWMSVPVGCLRYIFGCRYKTYGTHFQKRDKKILLVTNHRTRLDWFIMLPLLLDEGRIPSLRFTLKAPLRNVPFIGWFLQLNCHIFLNRNFEADKGHISKMLKFFQDFNDELTLVLYPEGTVLWPDTKAKSDAFAEQNNLPKFEQLIQPRVTGLKFLLDQGEQFDAIYDITTAYSGNIPQEESAAFTGAMPPMTHYLIQRFEISEVKKDAETWLRRQWVTKERNLENFYNNNNTFLSQSEPSVHQPSERIFPQLVQIITFAIWCWFCFSCYLNFYNVLPIFTVATVLFVFILQGHGTFAYWVLNKVYTK